MTQKPTTIETSRKHSAERWYLRIDGQRYGPCGRAELEKFLEPPRLCSVLEVKCGDDGVWCFITRSETIDKVLVKFGVEPDPVAEPAPQPVRGSRKPGFLDSTRDFFEGLSAWLMYHWRVAAAVLAIVAINAVVLLSLRDLYGREREILAQYEALWIDVRGFSAETSDEDWRIFAEPALSVLDPIVRELEKSAGVHHPSRQNLLFAGRDSLRPILKAEKPPGLQNPLVILFERRMQAAQAQFSAAVGNATTPNAKEMR